MSDTCKIIYLKGAIIQSSINEEQSKIHASLLSQITERASSLIETLDENNGDDLTFLRIRSKNREIMISPDKEYILVVIQNPTAVE